MLVNSPGRNGPSNDGPAMMYIRLVAVGTDDLETYDLIQVMSILRFRHSEINSDVYLYVYKIYSYEVAFLCS